jgi:hypothetical protein
MSLEAWNDALLWASVVFAILAAISTGGAIITGRTLDAKKDAQIVQLQARHITPKQKEELIALLKPTPKGPVFFRPLITSSEAVQFSDEIKDVLSAAGFEVPDTDLLRDGLLSLNRTGAFLWFKDKDNPPQHAKYLYEAFHRVGISLLGDPQPELSDPARLVIVVGSHP